ncbi:DDE-type integrase/transposase/recombinase [Acinetobacter baumannii]|jgi:putative transposase|nr:DDE-type integrase/transposase/recombinase [Acinetobacter baumannii]HCW5913697.1 DDE-type integrase/transposase/recombinase [Acinetobacter baumannii]
MRVILPGAIVSWKDRTYVLVNILTVNQVLLKDLETEKMLIVETSELNSFSLENKKSIHAITTTDWEKAWEVFKALQPLISDQKRKKSYEDVDKVAHLIGKGRTTVYRLLKKLQQDCSVTSIVRKERSDVGRNRTSQKIEEIINDKIENYYLIKERPSITELWEQITIECKKNNIKSPSQSTVARRVAQISDRTIMSKRISSKKAREKFEPIRGSLPDADYPLSIYQIDHTPMDVIIVDDKFRKPIGRPYLTIVIDSCSRMVAGFCISLDPVGALATGLALSHAILPKNIWLAKNEIDTAWPIYGVPQKILVDNAKEFRGLMIERACNEYGIILENRPKGLPQYGGTVERAFRTFMQKSQNLPGTTFSNTVEKMEYDSEAKSALTLSELERWFGVYIAKVYHQKAHKGLTGIPPIKKFEQLILGDADTPGIGLPTPIANPEKLHLDLMPYVERTIQEYGVLIDNIYYYADVLRPWIHARDLKQTKLKRKFIFARDPRDISAVYFLDPEQHVYFHIPYRNITHPAMSLWELRIIINELSKRPELQPNEDLIFEGLEEMRKIQEAAVSTSKAVRRMTQRKKQWGKAKLPEQSNSKNIESNRNYLLPELDAIEIKPFEDVQEAE